MKKYLSFFICAAATWICSADPVLYPRMNTLRPKDPVFRQVQDALAQSYAAEKSAGAYPDFFICSWITIEGDDVFSLAARFSVPYETLATLNGFEHPKTFKAGEEILVPSIPGIFIPDTARNDLDMIVASRTVEPKDSFMRLSIFIRGKATMFTFIPSARFYKTERTFFLTLGFRMPIQGGTLTSSYGFRRSPIDGHDKMHNGVDIAAPSGTPVMAARDGTVSAAGWDDALGRYVIITHDGGMSTVYGHLSRIDVELNQKLKSGIIIGTVGSTGLSTGPHLHFEIRVQGKAKDPAAYVHGIN